MSTDNATSPAASDDLSLGEEVADLKTGSDQSDLNGEFTIEGAEGAQTDPPVEDIEYDLDGEKVRIPSKVAEILSQRDNFNRDYTAKTTKLAEDRRAWDVERTQQSQAGEAVLNARAKAIALDSQIAQFDQFTQADWDAEYENNPANAARLDRQLRQLKEDRTAVDGTIAEAEQASTLEAQRLNAQRLQDGHAELARDIKDWSPAKAQQLAAFAQKEFGFTADELSQASDPRLIKLLNSAMTGKTTTTQQAQVDRIAQGQKTAPAQQVRGTGGKYTVAADTNDFAAFEKLADQRLKA